MSDLFEAIDDLILAHLALANVPWRDQIPDRQRDLEAKRQRLKATLKRALPTPEKQSNA